MARELHDGTYELVGETEKAIRVYDGKTRCWLPKSQIEFEVKVKDGRQYVEVTMPIWLAQDKELV